MRWQLLSVAMAFSTVASGQAPNQTAAPVSCMIGPLTKTIGGNSWLVYACADGKSLAVVSTPSIAPNWFYFVVAPHGDSYVISGEVNSDKRLSKPVFDELSAMSSDEVVALYREVRDSAKVDDPGDDPPDNTPEPTHDP